MMIKITLHGIYVLFLILLIGCGSGGDNTSDKNNAPIVNAGKDKNIIVNKTIKIIGTATDKDGIISSYEWEKGAEVLGTESSLIYVPTEIGIDTLTFTATDDDGESSSDKVIIIVKEENTSLTVDLPTTSKIIYKSMKKSESEIITNAISTLSFAYFRDEDKNQWYISYIDLFNKVNVYSLTPFRNGNNGWGTIGKNIASFDSEAESIKIDYIADNNEYRYYDEGWKSWNTDPMIQDHISWIRNDNVNIEWWFFKATNGSWYIINKAGEVWKFSSKNNNYDWIKIDMGGAKPIFSMDNGVKRIKYETSNTNKIISTYYDSSSRIVYVLASNGISNPRVYFAGRNVITNNCLGDNEEVHMMELQPITDVNTNVKANLEAGAKVRGINVNLGVEGSTSSSYQTPSVYYYDFDSLVIGELHYNIVAEQSGDIDSSGWLPDNGGGCIYTLNPLK